MPVYYRAVINTTLRAVHNLARRFAKTRVRRRGLSDEDRAKMTIVYLREHPTIRHLAASFGCSVSTAHSIITTGTGLLAERVPQRYARWLRAGARLPSEVYRKGHVLIDGTFIHTQNAWLRGYFNHKHKDCGVVFLVVTTPDGVPVWFSEPQPGSVHDMTLLKDSGILPVLEVAGVGVVADKGFQGLNPDLHLTPAKTPRGGRLTASEREYNRWVSRLRIPVETVFARLKQYRILVGCRRHVSTMGQVLNAVVALHELEERTW